MQTLSIIVPAYNEEAFIAEVLRQVLAVDTESLGFAKEVIVVDDCSADRTGEIASSFGQVTLLTQERNQGKGKAVQRGIQAAGGQWILIQDADLEYDPQDYLPMLRRLGQGGNLSVYGSRFLGQMKGGAGLAKLGKHPEQGMGPWLMNIVLGVITLVLYGTYISDCLTAYKLYPAELLKSFRLRTKGFEGDHEITARLIRAGVKIVEVPIAYHPRSVEEGKKIRARDGLIAMWTFLKYRFAA